jgi:hypothetical protein
LEKVLPESLTLLSLSLSSLSLSLHAVEINQVFTDKYTADATSTCAGNEVEVK